MAFFNEGMSERDIFLAYLVNADKGLFESGNFCLDDDDYYLLFKNVIKNYDGLALYEKYKCRLWGIYIRELVYRYAQSYKELWPDLKAGMNADVHMLLDKYCKDENEKNSVKAGKERFDRDNGDIQGFCYDGGGEALQKIFNGWNFENTEYHFQNRFRSSATRRYLEFLLKLSVLPANYLPTRGIYGLLRDAFVKSRCPYWSNESPSKIFLSKLRGILTNAGDGWKVHRNTIEAFRDRLLEYFTFVFSWKSCGYSYEEAEESLGQIFVFLSQKKNKNYLYSFLQEEYGLLNKESIDGAAVQKCSKKLFQFSYVLDKRTSLFYFKKPQGNIKFLLSTYLGNRDIRRINSSILVKVGVDEIAKINLNGALVFVDGGNTQNENLSVIKLAKEKRLALVWGNNELSIDNPWYIPNCWFLLDTFGTDSAKTWDVRNDAYLAIPKEFGEIKCGKELLSAQELSQEIIELLLPETQNSGLFVYKLHATPCINLEKISLSTSNDRCVEIKLKDVEYVRTIPNFKGSPTFVQQNLHSKIAIGQIEFEWPNYEDFPSSGKGINFSTRNGVLTIKNETQNIVYLDENNETLKGFSDLLRKRFPYIILLPSNAKIWISDDERVKMCHWFVGNEQLEKFALYGSYDSIKISNSSIEPSQWGNDKNVFRLTEPKWNESLLTSEDLSRTSSWIEPDFSEADLCFRWNEGKIQFKVVITPEERKTLENIYCQEYGKGLACIYRILEINGAYVTVGFSYKGKNIKKSFQQSSRYELNERASVYEKNYYDKIKCGEFLKNHLLQKKEIQKCCDELNEGFKLLGLELLDSEEFDSVESVKKKRILNFSIGPEKISLFDKDNVGVGKISFRIEGQADPVVVTNNSTSIMLVPSRLMDTMDGCGRYFSPDVIVFPKNTNICVLQNDDKLFLILIGDVDNLSQAWEYDEKSNVHYIAFDKNADVNGIPITDGRNVRIAVSRLEKCENVHFLTEPSFNLDYVWFRYNKIEEFGTDYPEILSKGLASILHALPIENGTFEFMFQKGSNYFYNIFKESVPLKHLSEHNSDKIKTSLYDRKDVPVRDLLDMQKLLGVKSTLLLSEYIISSRKEQDKLSLFRWICSIGSLNQTEIYALVRMKTLVESKLTQWGKWVSDVQREKICRLEAAKQGYSLINQGCPSRLLLDSLTASNGFIQSFYKGVEWARNLQGKKCECECFEMLEHYKALKTSANYDPVPIGSWKILWSIKDVENGRIFVPNIFSSSREWKRKNLEQNVIEKKSVPEPAGNPLNATSAKKSYDERKTDWENLLRKYGVSEAALSGKKFKFEPYYYQMKDDQLEARAKILAGK